MEPQLLTTPSSDSAPVLLVTGSSRGIGAAIARLAGRAGYRVAVNSRRGGAEAERVVSEICAEGRQARLYPADIGDPAAVTALFAAIDRDWGPLAVLVNNAGLSGGAQPLATLPRSVLHEVMATNLLGAFYCAQEAITRMAHSAGGQGGAIINISSEAARFGGHQITAYAAAKAGLNALTLGAARELAVEGIRVNAVSPGVIATAPHDHLNPARREAILASIPLRRMGTPEEVAAAVLWLASPEASYITGAILPITGGR
jgi:NAD(P)-dependent dehydrogenase (short-subunit alcohol dehydrogenase family)